MQIGEVLDGRYQIRATAGVGGMSVVYRAVDGETGASVAVKVLQAGNEDWRKRFAREVAVLASLRHPGIVRYLGHGATPDGGAYLVTEWLDGEDLARRLERDALSTGETVALLAGVCEALAEAHRSGVVHRDLKPANVFLVGGRAEHAKLLDFGIARWADHEDAAAVTRSGAVIGTPRYMAPEQARAGGAAVDARADVFALGAVAFRCLTGRDAFEGQDPVAVLMKVVLEDPPRVRELQREVPAALDALVAAMLAKAPAARPPDANAVAAALAAVGASGDTARAACPAAAPAAVTAGERRVRCVVLARAGEAYASDAPTLAPSAASRIRQAQVPASLRAAVGPLGGTLHLLADGSVVVTPALARGAATDQAAHAARLALAVRDALPDAAVVVTAARADGQGRVAMGELIERGVVLLRRPDQVARGQNGVWLDEVAAGLLDARFDVRADARGSVLLAERGEASGAGRTLLGRPTPFVGREPELAALRAALAQCASERVARAVLITGAAGSGKSRLCHEFLRGVRAPDAARGDGDPTRAQVWRAGGDPMSAHSPFGLAASLVRRAAGVRDGEPLETRRSKLRARVGRTVPLEARERVACFLGELAGTPFADDHDVQLRAARRDHLVMGDQIRRAWEDWLLAECDARPLVLVLEDLHWGDLPSVKLVDAALRHLRDRPLMVLALARPEVDELFPRLWSARGVQHTRMGELSRRACARLVRAALGPDVAGEALARILDRASGNAFYLEELVRAEAAGRAESLPATLVAMTQARLEALEPEARRVLRAASVFGQVFWAGGVGALLGGASTAAAAHEWFDALAEREVIFRRPEARFAGETEYVFRHALVREAAYAMLTDADRARGHRCAAEWLEGEGERDALTLAEHFACGAAPGRAVAWYRRSAEHAFDGNDFAAAVARAARGVACLEADAAAATGVDAGVVRGALRLLQAEALQLGGNLALAEAAATEAASLFDPASREWFAAVALLVATCGRQARFDAMGRWIEALLEAPHPPDAHRADALRALVRAEEQAIFSGWRGPRARLRARIAALEDRALASGPEEAVWVYYGRANEAYACGDTGAYLRLEQALVAGFEATGDLRSACRQRSNTGDAMLEIGAYEEAAATLRAALGAAERMGLGTTAAAIKHNLGWALCALGERAEGRRVLEEALALFVENDDVRAEAGTRIYLAWCLVAEGELALAEREARRAAGAGAGDMIHAIALAALANVLLAQPGRHAEALAAANEAGALCEAFGGLHQGDALVRLVRSEALFASGARDAARRALADARARLLDRADKLREPSLRASFLARVPEHARTLRLAREWEI